MYAGKIYAAGGKLSDLNVTLEIGMSRSQEYIKVTDGQWHVDESVNPCPAKLVYLNFHPPRHNLKWAKITHTCLIWDKTFAYLDV